MLTTTAGLSLFAGDISAQDNQDGNDPTPDTVVTPGGATIAPVDVLQVSGFMDDILISEIRNAIERADDSGAQALILQVNSDGTVVDDNVVETLLEDIATAPVPIGVWVGPTGSRFYGPAAQMLSVADVTGMAPGARVGYIGVPLNPPSAEIDFGVAEEVLRNGSVGLSEARALNIFRQRISDEGIPTVTSMLQAMNGYQEAGIVLVTTEQVVTDDGNTRFDTVAIVRFSKLSLIDQLFHTVASPPVAYLLLLTGLALLVFEFFTAGVGVAGVVGAICTFLAFSGLAVLPTRTWAVVVIGLAMLAFSIDVQVGIPRFWTGVGLGLTLIGTWFLFEPLPGANMRPGWIALFTGLGGIALTFIVGMPNMVRTRFATPTIGREWMIGELGIVIDDVDPDGVVEVGNGRWRARTNRATPVRRGDEIRVAAIDGITLEVEPLEGAAKDYRERRTSADDVEPPVETVTDGQTST
ncbi:NfeD family protein [uncultured Ilumatobacter sp.]|uniref:NfeD family protein n=1 Tax=uncultured Ilumatobacter sp. TaxID=879968 RepID=UPI00374E99F3